MTSAQHKYIGKLRQDLSGARLRRIREDRGLSLRQLGAALDVSAVFLCNVENGFKHCPQWLTEGYKKLK